MTQLAAYHVNPPQGINLNQVIANAQQTKLRDFELQTAPGKVALTNAQNSNALAEQSALGDYRTAAEAGDPNAADAFNGQPEHMKKLADAFGGMSPEEYMTAKEHGLAFGKAAQIVMSFPDGSKEQQKAWDQQTGELYKNGFIDKNQHDLMVSSGPNKEMLNEAMSVGEFVASHSGPKADVANARIKDIGIDNARADKIGTAKIEAKSADTEADNARADLDTASKIAAREKRQVTLEDINAARIARIQAQTENDKTKADAKAADTKVDNERADKNVNSQITARETKAGKGKDGAKGLTPSQVITATDKVERLIATYAKEGTLNADQLAAKEAELRVKFGLPAIDQTQAQPIPKPMPGGNTSDVPPAMADRVQGQVYDTPKGPLIWTGTGWDYPPKDEGRR